MRWPETLRLRVRGLLFRTREGQRLNAEMQFHLDSLIVENIAAGMSAEERAMPRCGRLGMPRSYASRLMRCGAGIGLTNWRRTFGTRRVSSCGLRDLCL
jgi:hypothetical protein